MPPEAGISPPDESERLAELKSYGILDTAPDARFDRIARLAAAVLHTNYAYIGFVDEHRTWFKSRINLPAEETAREHSFVARAIRERRPLAVRDAMLDPVLREKSYVKGPPGIRFIAAAPLTTPRGYNVGALAVSDSAPRDLSREEEKILSDLSGLAMDALESHRDALALKAAEAESRAASRAKTEFLASISYELRTPLNAIKGFAETIRHGLFGPVGNPKYADYARDIARAAEDLGGILDAVLDYNRAEPNRARLELKAVPIAPQVETALEVLRPDAAERRVTFNVDAAVDDEFAVRADRRALRAVLDAVLSNAVKFSHKGGVVSVSYGPAKDGRRAEIAVQDGGIGIGAEQLRILGAPFPWSETVPRSREQGIGLGLATATRLMQAMGGTLSVESQVGKGTTVTLALARAR
jgi:two-component system, sensor histidine kinase